MWVAMDLNGCRGPWLRKLMNDGNESISDDDNEGWLMMDDDDHAEKVRPPLVLEMLRGKEI